LKQVAIYARVSGERQAREATIESQVSALKEVAASHGATLLPSDQYIDDGYTGSTLLRPALEKLRDRAATGELDILYVHSPDRLARKYAYQVLLLDEFMRAGTSVVFLNHPAGDSPEDQLLVQVQGIIAEYERAKIIERCRRGKLYKAKKGSINPLSGAPYGYLYVKKMDGRDARYEILEEEARNVRQMFDWFVLEQLTLNGIARRLVEKQIPTRTGRSCWDRGTVWGILRNPAYKGQACFGKTYSVERERTTRPARLSTTGVPKHAKSSSRQKGQEHWIPIEVPAIVPATLFESAQDQLGRNRQLSQRNNKGRPYLLRGLLVCQKCSHALYAKRISLSAGKGKQRDYAYYRCGGTDAYRYQGERICDMHQIRTDQLDNAVWDNVKQLMQDPARVVAEFTRRSHEETREVSLLKSQRHGLVVGKQKAESALQRLIDAYQAGAIDLHELKPRSDQARLKLKSLDTQIKELDQTIASNCQLVEIVTRLADFTARLDTGLDNMAFEERVKLVRLLVNRLEVSNDDVAIIYRIPGSGKG
jgi:site-specific DNA recombinase